MAVFLLLFRGVRSLHRLVLAGLLALSCATAPKRSEGPPPRVKDSAPEKIAAQRAATPGLYLEQDADGGESRPRSSGAAIPSRGRPQWCTLRNTAHPT
jgi:hypothetical protein